MPTKECIYLSIIIIIIIIIILILDCMCVTKIFFPFLFDMVSIVAKTTKFE